MFHPVFLNNTIANARVGLTLATPDADAMVKNNIFFGTSIAILRVGDGSPSPNVSYNCFYENTLNFSGYQGIYGLVVTANYNNNPCDAFSNIFLDPRFSDGSNYLLSVFSPCIDAGDPAISDLCFAFRRGH